MNKLKSCGLLTVSTGLLMLAACGDENTTNNYDNTAIESYSEKSLPDCTKENEGSLAYVRTDETLRVCYDTDWYVISGKNGETGETGDKGEKGDKGETGEKGKTGKSGDNGTGCTVSTLADSTGLKLTCDGDSIGIILNGEPGEKGSDGDNGDDCVPCTTEALADEIGYKIVCGGDSVAVVYNGKVLTASPNSSSANNTSPVVTSSSSSDKHIVEIGSSSSDKPIQCKQLTIDQKNDYVASKYIDSEGNTVLPGNFEKLKEVFDIPNPAWGEETDCKITITWYFEVEVTSNEQKTEIADVINAAAEGSGLFSKGAYTLPTNTTASHYDGCSEDHSYCIEIEYEEKEYEAFTYKSVVVHLEKHDILE